MRIIRLVPVFLLAALVAGCSTAGQKAEKALESPVVVKSKSDPAAEFSKYSTWSFVPLRADAELDPRLDDPEVKAGFHDAVEGGMFTRGYRRVELSDNPDLLVNAHVTTEKIDAAYMQEHYEGHYEPGYRTTIDGQKLANEWEEGTIIIIVFDAQTRAAVWGASAQGEAYENLDSGTRRQRVEKAVRQMMESLPAKK